MNEASPFRWLDSDDNSDYTIHNITRLILASAFHQFILIIVAIHSSALYNRRVEL